MKKFILLTYLLLSIIVLVDSRRDGGGGGRSNSHSSHYIPSNYYQHKGNVQKVWETAATIKGRNPDKYRMDASNTVIHRDQYGNAGHKGSWVKIDHIKPQSKGGSDHINNLQALNSHDNRAYGNR
jgi:hypothetical protein